ncbi:AAC-rich mRNA clone AAC4 protein-like [Aplysia californica]|uniref:AAC-rich mRNA clone AAC4 protein-like n=1 Tax=Aplysia californica TaxID=6500 RepID=A0ABM1W4W6_APLCA|nr:AAC-rich mRNA clone AAC4 protein-like [Aplysia californica]
MTSLVSFESLLLDPETPGVVSYNYDEDYEAMSDGAKRMLKEGNAGGCSIMSEAYSFNLIKQKLLINVELWETETKIQYRNRKGKITDYTINFEKRRFAVQVTRAMYHPKDRSVPVKRLKKEIDKKLKGIKESSQNASLRWEKQILHVWCQDSTLSEVVEDAFMNADAVLRGNTILLVSEVLDDYLREKIF